MTLMDPELVNDQVNVLIDVSKTTNNGLPKWELMGIDVECMVGDPAVGNRRPGRNERGRYKDT